MNAHFFLRKHGKQNPIIVLSVTDARLPGRRVKISTGLSIESQDWDKRKNRLKLNPPRVEENVAINQQLDSLAKTVIQFASQKYNELSINVFEIRNAINKQLPTKIELVKSLQPEEKADFFDLWKRIIETTKNSEGLPITQSSIETKMQTLRLVKEFAAIKKVIVDLSSINMEFYYLFDQFLQWKKYSLNTRGKHFKEIKAMLREAMDRDYDVNQAFRKKKFKVMRGRTENTYLTIDEIKALLKVKLPEYLDAVRFTFVMACFVGIRFSDWWQLSENNIVSENGRELFIIKQTKTKEIIHIPVHPLVRIILRERSGSRPAHISNQKMNVYIKEVCKLANLGQVLLNGKFVEKWTTISTHTARRSFATNAYLSKSMEVYQIMKCTGHKKESSFLEYLKLNGKDYAMQAADSDFFSPNPWLEISKAS